MGNREARAREAGRHGRTVAQLRELDHAVAVVVVELARRLVVAREGEVDVGHVVGEAPDEVAQVLGATQERLLAHLGNLTLLDLDRERLFTLLHDVDAVREVLRLAARGESRVRSGRVIESADRREEARTHSAQKGSRSRWIWSYSSTRMTRLAFAYAHHLSNPRGGLRL